MTMPMSVADELRSIADIVCDGLPTEDEAKQLENLLRGNAEAQRFYLACVRLDGYLRWEFRNQIPKMIDRRPLLIPPLHNSLNYLPESWSVSYMIATVIMGIGALIAGFTYVTHHTPVAEWLPVVTRDHVVTAPQMEFVGRITGMVDCRWADESTAAINGAYVPLDRKYALSSGLMEISYGTGARVILQGPATYIIESNNGGFLSIGTLTGKVTTEDAKGFAVRTPTATVTDLGTEFGVEVDKRGVTETRVFTGKVRLKGRSRANDVPVRIVSAGQAVRFDPSTGIVDVSRKGERQFIRKMPASAMATGPELIDRLDYSDTWTANSRTRAGSYLMLEDPISVQMEQCHDNPPRSWVFGTQSAMTTWIRYDQSLLWPGFQAPGSKSGFMECGGNCYFGFEYGLRDDFIVQFDAVQTTDYVNITVGNRPAEVKNSELLSVFFRAHGTSAGAQDGTPPEIGIYHALAKGEADTELHSGIAGAYRWHNYAVRFNLPAKQLTVWVDRECRGTIDLDALKHGEGAPAWSELPISGRYVTIGGYSGEQGGPVWTDNFRVGTPQEAVMRP